ncbi:MAG TPA: ABC transporter ATP-binding protein [Streptosporangiaceae bacterium]|nr:ABC transporter ATP-binding protein [Streptosporangiaceae bacterium]
MRKSTTVGESQDGIEVASGSVAGGGPPSGEQFITADHLTMRYTTRRASTVALDDVNFSVARREFVSVIGQSGCGKTTLLRILAGLIRPTDGTVQIDGKRLWQGTRRDDQALRLLGLVFQDAHLFPWYTVEDNIGLPLRLRGASRREWRAKAHELAELVQLKGFERAYPRELSGGMRQRVAIARALSYNPEILLMDEPFGALDAMTRDRMNLELQSIAEATGATVVFVTHSITEAVFMSDRVVLLSARPGRLRSITPIEIDRPRDLELQSDPVFQNTVRELRHQLYEDEERTP